MARYKLRSDGTFVAVKDDDDKNTPTGSLGQPTELALTEGEVPEGEDEGGITASGIATELAIATSGNVAAVAAATALSFLPPAAALAYVSINAASGVLGSYTRQTMEGGELSYGEMAFGGFANQFGPAGKTLSTINAATKITPKVVGKTALQLGEHGTVLGLGYPNVVSLIDDGKLASEEETLDSAAIGLAAGTGLGTLAPYAKKGFHTAQPYIKGLFNKFTGKTSKQIDIEVANGKITPKDLQDFDDALQKGNNEYSLFQEQIQKQVLDKKTVGPTKPVFSGNLKDNKTLDVDPAYGVSKVPESQTHGKQNMVVVEMGDGIKVSVPKSEAARAAWLAFKSPEEQASLITGKPVPYKKDPEQKEMFLNKDGQKEVGPEMARRIASVQDKLLTGETTAAFDRAANAVDGEGILAKVWDRSRAWTVPSVITGRGPQDEIFYGQRAMIASQEEAGLIHKQIGKYLKANSHKSPNLEDEITKFLEYGAITPSMRANPKLLKLMDSWVDRVIPLQQKMMQQVSVFELDSLEGTKAQDFLKAAGKNIERTGFYNVRQYEAMTNVDFVLDKGLKKRAINAEVARYKKEYREKGVNLSEGMALKMAQGRVQTLISTANTARNMSGEVGSNPTATSKNAGVLQQLEDITPETRKFLGEIKDPVERMRGTMVNLSELVYKNEIDIGIIKHLRANNLSTTTPPNDNTFVPLTLPSAIKTDGLFVPIAVQSALNNSVISEMTTKANSNMVKELGGLWQAGVAVNKGMKVIFSLAAYPVNASGAISTIISGGILPTFKNGMRFAKGVRMGNSNKVDAEMYDLKKAGILAQSVVVDDLRNAGSGTAAGEYVQKIFGPAGKVYSSLDVGARYAMYRHHKETLGKIWPKASEVEIRQAAILQTNDEMQNYDSLSKLYKQGSRYGALPTFAAYSGALVRNHFHQANNNRQMVLGTFGKQYGLDPAKAAPKKMQAQGYYRSALQIGVVAGAAAAIEAMNLKENVGKPVMTAVKRFLPDWVKNKKLAMKFDPVTLEYKYINAEYYVPQLLPMNAIDAVREGKSLEDVYKATAGVFSDNFVGGGNILMNSLYESVTNKDEFGNPVSTKFELFQNVKERIYRVVADTANPAFVRGIDKALDKGDPIDKLLLKWASGQREKTGNLKDSARFAQVSNVKNLRQVKSEYTRVRDYGTDNTPESLNKAYGETEAKYRQYWNKAIEDDKALQVIGVENNIEDRMEEVRIGALTTSGFSKQQALYLLDGKYLPMAKDRPTTTQEIYDELHSRVGDGGIASAIVDNDSFDIGMKKKLLTLYKRDAQSVDVGSREELFKGLNAEQQVKYLEANPHLYEGYKSNRSISKKALLDIMTKY